MACLFCDIVEKKIPAKIVFEDDMVVAFRDINPQAPLHLLVIPRKHISTINDLTEEASPVISHMVITARNLAKELGFEESGYRLVLNCNNDGGQTVFHIHLHLLGGRLMEWPPG